MKYVPPLFTSDPMAPYVDANPDAGIEGSIPGAAAFNEPLNELANFISFSGLVPSDTDLTQLTQGVRLQRVNYGVDTGSVNALSVALVPPLSSYAVGTPLRVLVGNSNTGASTINVNGLGVRAIKRPDGSDLGPGDLKAGGIANLVDDGAHYQLVNYLGLSGGPGTTISINIPYCADTSPIANAITAIYSPAITALVEGNFLAVKIANANNGPVTMTVNALAPYPVYRNDGQPMQNGDLPAGMALLLEFHGTYFQSISMVRSQSWGRLAADLTLYVRTDGSDANNGSANDAAHAFRTIQAAISYVAASFYIAGRNVTIQMGIAGTYDSFFVSNLSQGLITVRGDPANQDSYIIPNGSANQLIEVLNSNVALVGLQINDTTGVKVPLFVVQGSQCSITNVSFNGSAGSTNRPMVDVNRGCEVTCYGTIKFMVSCQNAFYAQGGTVTCGLWSCVITTVGGPTFTAFAYANTLGFMAFTYGYTSFGGTAQGPRFNVTTNSVINSYGGGANFLPGNAVGLQSSGGIYLN